MNEEIFDVVDERDVVIGQNTRAEVHRLGLRHRAVHVLVFDRHGHIFLQKRSLLKDRQAGLWDSSSSGHVDAAPRYQLPNGDMLAPMSITLDDVSRYQTAVIPELKPVNCIDRVKNIRRNSIYY